ncbi:MAG: hypothetical protein FWH34_00220 [Desulfovibrionaceae bacterium]|nr:hypothetical protein [Desulfovibrionaceae bacterium]
MKKALLHYVAGLCQAASAALLAGAVIVPDMQVSALWGAATAAFIGAVLVVLREKGGAA